MAVNRNFARTPGPRVSQSLDSHVSSICQLPGPPGIPPPAALTSVICNGFLLRLFLLPPSVIFLLSSFLWNLPPLSSVIFRPTALCLIPQSPYLLISPKRGPRNPPCSAVGENAESSRGGVSGTKKMPGEPSLNLKNRGKWGPRHPVSAPKCQKGRDVIAFEDLSTFGPHCFWTWR